MKNKLPLRDEFTDWLINAENLTEGTATSYCSYVSSAFNLIQETLSNNKQVSVFNLITTYLQKEQLDQFTHLIEKILHLYHNDTICSRIKKSEKTVSNWISGINRYMEFISVEVIPQSTWELDTTKPEDIDDSIAYEGTEGEIIYSPLADIEVYGKDELTSNFQFRLITQDRYYKNIYYPIGLVKRILYRAGKRKNFDHNIQRMIDNIVIHTQSQQLRFADIEKLKINTKTKNVTVVTKQGETSVYTPIHGAENNPLKVDRLSDISLDHIEPMYDVMNGMCDQLTEFNLLTEEIKNKVEGNMTYDKMKKSYTLIMKGNIMEAVNISRLEEELALLSDRIELQLMDKRENTIKGKN